MSFVALCLAARSQAVGAWQDHNSFVAVHSLQDVGDRVYAATRSAMFYYDKDDHSVGALTKVSGLSDVGIATFAYDEGTRCLAVAYNNSGLDLLIGAQAYHISDIRNGNISGDKKIYHVRFHAGRAYLATGFGIVVVNIARGEIEDTYYLGENGQGGLVYDVAFLDSLIVAATDNGLLYAPKDARLHISDVWARDTLSPLRGMSVRMLDVCRGRLLAAACTNNPDSMTTFYEVDDGVWGSWGVGRVESLRYHNGRIVVSHYDYLDVFDEQYSLIESVRDVSTFGMAAWDVDCDDDGTLWMAHPWAGLIQCPQGRATAYSHAPMGPFNDDYVYSLVAANDKLYLCPGGKKPTYESAFIPGSISMYDNKSWTQIARGDNVSDFQDVLYLAADPKNRKHLSATSWGYGVLDIQDNVIQEIYNGTNTDGVLRPYTVDDFSHLRVSGLAYDDKGNLWVTNSLVDNGLAVRYRDGEWAAFDISPLLQGLPDDKREIDKLIWDSIYGYKWFAGKANRIYLHDGESKLVYVNPNNGSKLETHTVTCLVQDRSGDIWFGTDKGVKVIYDGYRAFSNGGHGEMSPITCCNILYNEDGINEYLMAYESITCMAVDGANRKWVGTANNGLYLISANGLEQLHHFTTANSPLASDKIVALTVYPESGVLFVGTDKGLQSYRSTATGADVFPSSDIHAFPNPVRPGFDGVVSIKGFTRDALVHITDARGHVVFSTTAQGGQAEWNCLTRSGDRAASGTYFVFASDQYGTMRSVAKVLIIR